MGFVSWFGYIHKHKHGKKREKLQKTKPLINKSCRATYDFYLEDFRISVAFYSLLRYSQTNRIKNR
jgi:hypothetical protein